MWGIWAFTQLPAFSPHLAAFELMLYFSSNFAEISLTTCFVMYMTTSSSPPVTADVPNFDSAFPTDWASSPFPSGDSNPDCVPRVRQPRMNKFYSPTSFDVGVGSFAGMGTDVVSAERSEYSYMCGD